MSKSVNGPPGLCFPSPPAPGQLQPCKQVALAVRSEWERGGDIMLFMSPSGWHTAAIPGPPLPVRLPGFGRGAAESAEKVW